MNCKPIEKIAQGENVTIELRKSGQRGFLVGVKPRKAVRYSLLLLTGIVCVLLLLAGTGMGTGNPFLGNYAGFLTVACVLLLLVATVSIAQSVSSGLSDQKHKHTTNEPGGAPISVPQTQEAQQTQAKEIITKSSTQLSIRADFARKILIARASVRVAREIQRRDWSQATAPPPWTLTP